MAKCRAKIQRAYREKHTGIIRVPKKEKPEKGQTYVSSNKLFAKDRQERNRKDMANSKEFYARKRAARVEQVMSETRGYESNGNCNGVESTTRQSEERAALR